MKITKTVCDQEDCKGENAAPHSLFKERKMDGAGSMENWFYIFDLCPHHTSELLDELLDNTMPDKAQLLTNCRIKWRVE